MSYQSTVNEIRAVANVINPTGRFDHGRIVDASAAFAGDYPLIWLYPFNTLLPLGDDSIDDNTLLVGFWVQDSPSSTNAEREANIAAMYDLCKQFFTQLGLSKIVRVSQRPTLEPQYQMYGGTVCGYAARFNYQNFSPCD
jgi:hypothetical protein